MGLHHFQLGSYGQHVAKWVQGCDRESMVECLKESRPRSRPEDDSVCVSVCVYILYIYMHISDEFANAS